MTIKQKVELLNAAGVHNSHNFCTFGNGRIFVSYTARARMNPSRWSVVGVRESVCPDAPWYDYGHKTFSGTLRSGADNEAKTWASQKYGIETWAKDPFGGYQDATVLAAAYAKAGIK